MNSKPWLLGIGVVSVALVVGACGGDENEGSPTAPTPTSTSSPTPTSTSVSVTFPAGGPIFIGGSVQFEARETLSNGTTRVATAATWSTNAPAVATVSPTGLVTAVSAGEATIIADVNPRGVRRIRVLPNFGGSWAGSVIVTSCEDSEDWEGFCDLISLGPGDAYPNQFTFTQTEASVDAVVGHFGDTARGMGIITVGGELQFPSMPVLPTGTVTNKQIQNWRSRADTPSQMTGTYDEVITAPGDLGFLKFGWRLRDVVSTSTPTALQLGTGGGPVTERVRQWRANRK